MRSSGEKMSEDQISTLRFLFGADKLGRVQSAFEKYIGKFYAYVAEQIERDMNKWIQANYVEEGYEAIHEYHCELSNLMRQNARAMDELCNFWTRKQRDRRTLEALLFRTNGMTEEELNKTIVEQFKEEIEKSELIVKEKVTQAYQIHSEILSFRLIKVAAQLSQTVEADA